MLKNIFKKTQTETKSVYCEITGNKTTIDNTVVLVKIDGVIALKNLNNPSIDFENNVINSMDRAPLIFYSELIVPDVFKEIFGRIFSIIDDVDEIEQSTAIMSKEGQIAFSTQNLLPFMEHVDNGVGLIKIPKTMSFAVIDTITSGRTKVCENWGINYNALGRKYRFKKILDEKIENHTFGKPGILKPGFDIAVSDCSQKNPNGKGYMYKTDGSFKSIDLCCNESAVSFCKNNNALVYYNDFLNNAELRVLSPKTESINRNLQNSYLYRSSNI